MSKRNKNPKIDLHGVRHADVFNEVDKFISNNLYADTLEIVTGFSPSMKDLVQNVLSDYKLIGIEPEYNSGVLIIKL